MVTKGSRVSPTLINYTAVRYVRGGGWRRRERDTSGAPHQLQGPGAAPPAPGGAQACPVHGLRLKIISAGAIFHVWRSGGN